MRGAINPRGADIGLGLSAEGEVLCLNLCPALGETSLMLCTGRQTSKPWDIHPQILQALQPAPATAWHSWCVVLCSRDSLGQDIQVFCWEGEQEVAYFAVILVTLLPPLICGAVLVQTTSLLGLEIEWKNLVRGVLGA